MEKITSQIIQGDCLEVMREIKTESVDLVVTSPPYGNRRKSTYGGVNSEDYVKWFLLISEQIKRILKPKGSFVLNIKENYYKGQRDIYVLELILALRKKQNWKQIDEFVWNKSNPVPGIWSNRLKDGWERCLHFSKQTDIKFNRDSVKTSSTDKQKNRRDKFKEKDYTAWNSANKSGLSVNHSKACGLKKVYPSNVLVFGTASFQGGHPAVFPVSLPDFFIRLFTDKGDVVLDPFFGSGTTGVAAQKLGRKWIGIEKQAEYVDVAKQRLGESGKLI